MAINMTRKAVLIKKYENRRLYDTTNSRYVNLEEVAQMLRQGDEVRVTDAASGEDITRLILTQIIVEDAKLPNSAFPLDVLRQMVMASGKASQESALKYMKALADIYQNSYRAMSPPFNPFDFMQSANAFRGVPMGAQPVAEEPIPVPPAGGGANDEMEKLKTRLAELEKMVTTLKPPKKGARKK
jgi:polyhydroxyalkanoate synthesis repressor PhaR